MKTSENVKTKLYIQILILGGKKRQRISKPGWKEKRKSSKNTLTKITLT